MIHYMTTNGIGNAWVANELLHVRQAGVPVTLHALRKPEATFHASPWAQELDRATRGIYPLPPVGLLVSVLLAPLLFGTRFWAALGNALFGEREHLRARLAALAHFFVACHWARQVRHEPMSLIHCQWVHSSGTVGMYGGWLLNKPFSFTGHAADLFRDRVALRDKVRRAKFIICISEFHRDFFRQLGADDAKLQVVYCGIDLAQFHLPEQPVRNVRPRLLASGRLVEKKGFGVLLEACRLLKERGVAFDCIIGGNGPLEGELRQQVTAAGLDDCVSLTGQMLKQEAIPAFMHQGDVYCLPCVWSRDNDVDGLPQMLMEALACGLPVISTRLVGIPDLIVHERTGLLVEPQDPAQLADAIERLFQDPTLAQQLAKEGRAWLYQRFDLTNCLTPLIQRFQRQLPLPPPPEVAQSISTVEPGKAPAPRAATSSQPQSRAAEPA